MLKNRFIKLEITNDKSKVSFEREKNVLSIKLFDNEIISYKLDFNISKDSFFKILQYYNIAKTGVNGERDEEQIKKNQIKIIILKIIDVMYFQN